MILKYIVLFFSITLLTSTAKADPHSENLFGSPNFTSGGYGGPEIKVSMIDDRSVLLLGGRGGWIIDKTFSLGVGGYGLVSRYGISNYKPTLKDVKLNLGYGGLYMEYIYDSNSLIHFTINSLIGAGGISYSESKKEVYEDSEIVKYETTAFFIFEPGANLEINLFKFMRLNLGLSYRLTSGIDQSRTKDKDLSKLSGNLSLKFGKF